MILYLFLNYGLLKNKRDKRQVIFHAKVNMRGKRILIKIVVDYVLNDFLLHAPSGLCLQMQDIHKFYT